MDIRSRKVKPQEKQVKQINPKRSVEAQSSDGISAAITVQSIMTAPSRNLNPSNVLRLQRTIGNQAVLRLLRQQDTANIQHSFTPIPRNPKSFHLENTAPAKVSTLNQSRHEFPQAHQTGVAQRTTSALPLHIQRGEGHEHETLGNVTGLEVDIGDGVVLTWGQVVALAGDEFGSLQELQDSATTPDGKARIRAALEHTGVPGTAASTLPVPTDSQRQTQLENYVKLASENVSHFSSDNAALNAWYAHHSQAIEQAMMAGLATTNTSDIADLNQAYVTEAFGQHFLTDMFSGGHIRTPRGEIIEWYTQEFAPAVVDTMINNLRERFVDEIYQQVRPQQNWFTRWFVSKEVYRRRIRKALNKKINEGIKSIGRQELIRYLGLIVGGIVSRAIHDVEGERGVVVSSEAHPMPWTAYGDDQLSASPDSENQAKAAILAAVQDLELAYSIGTQESITRQDLPEPDTLPAKVLFAYNSDKVEAAAQPEVQKAAAYLLYHPDTYLELVGHADPIGGHDFNDDLSQRRAESVGRMIIGAGVKPTGIAINSQGENQLLTKNPRRYAQNRRVEFVWSSQPTVDPTDPVDIAQERAREAIRSKIGPPYRSVERFLPYAVETAPNTSGPNPDLPDWHWGSLPAEIQGSANKFVSGYIKKFRTDILASGQLDKDKVRGFDIEPRPIVEGILDDLANDPAGFLSKVFGR